MAARTRASTVISPPPDPVDGLILKEAEELDLQTLRQLSDLVQKQRPSMSHLDAALALHVGPGERPFLVAEQFALQKVFRDGPAVNHHEGHAAPVAVLVNGPGHQLLAGAALPADQHRNIGRGHLADDGEDLFHLGAGAQHSGEWLSGHLLLQKPILMLQLRDMGSPVEHHLEFFNVDGFAEKIIGPFPDSLKAWSFCPWPVTMMTFTRLSPARISARVAKPSSGCAGLGGRPRSRVTTAGFS